MFIFTIWPEPASAGVNRATTDHIIIKEGKRVLWRDVYKRQGNEWGIGSSSENNGVLLLLSIGEQDYQCIQGSGLEDSLSTMTLSRILQEDLEPDFAAGDYDAGVQKTFDTLYRQVCAIYGLDPSNPAANVAPGAGYEQPAS